MLGALRLVEDQINDLEYYLEEGDFAKAMEVFRDLQDDFGALLFLVKRCVERVNENEV